MATLYFVFGRTGPEKPVKSTKKEVEFKDDDKTTSAEYERRADVWPLNPDGDLLAIMMIETTEGLKNADAIAAVPGVGAIFVGAGGDLHQYLGVETNSPEVEQAFQSILKACQAHNVACGITARTRTISRRSAQGWKMIRSPDCLDSMARRAK
jgi:2-keto-3-deoxy-L-rhamnonate aldolase RhmA